MTRFNLDIACGTDTGRVRKRNEDNLRILPKHHLVILSDGMGGHKAGDVASQIAVNTVGDYWNRIATGTEETHRIPAITGSPICDRLLYAVTSANEEIYTLALSKSEFEGMGATLIAAHFSDSRIDAVHLGDSRLYRLRNFELEQLTTDHTHAQESLRRGLITADQAKSAYGHNLLLRALGVDSVIEPDLISATVRSGDIYLFCSDGLTDMVEDEQIRMLLQQYRTNLYLCADQLITAANLNGGHDNVSVLLVRAD